MTIVETVLVFVGIPAGITAVLAFGVYGRSLLHQPNRYRPGKAWNFAPSWYVAHPEALSQPITSSDSVTAVGGASGEW
jgi:hypothetical protein